MAVKALLLVGLGGGIGSIARYLLGTALRPERLGIASGAFPLGTFTVNILGCLVIGVLAALAERHALFDAELRLLLFTGLLGGFTTFSAFGLETVALLRRGDLGVALAYVGASVLLGVLAVWLGMRVVEALSPGA